MIPRSLKLKSSVCGHKANNILCKAEKSLFTERIHQINFRISQFQNQKLDVEECLLTHLPSDRYEIVEFTYKSAVAETAVCKPRQHKKFANLVEKEKKQTKSKANSFSLSPEEIEEVISRWVINVLDYDLKEHELSVSEKRPQFCCYTYQNTIMITAVETAVRHVGLESTEAAKIQNKARH